MNGVSHTRELVGPTPAQSKAVAMNGVHTLVSS